MLQLGMLAGCKCPPPSPHPPAVQPSCCSSECAVHCPPPTLCTAIMLQRHKEYEQSKLHLLQFRDLFDEQDEDVKHADQEIIDQAHALGRLLGI